MDNKDADVAQTAVRETCEEIGLQPSDIEIWGRLHGTFPGRVCIKLLTVAPGCCWW